MTRIRLTNTFPDWPLLRQTPVNAGSWRDCQFHLNSDLAEADYWVVYGDLPEDQTCACAVESVIYICGEPPSVEKLSPAFLAQFGAVVSAHPYIEHPRHIMSHSALPWMAGIRQMSNGQWDPQRAMTYEDLKLAQPAKTKLLSVISSAKTNTPGHAARYEFVKKLKSVFGSDIDVYGRGVVDFEDKWDALAPYRYHIAIENSAVPHYWTEKLSDAILAQTYPIYYGCTNIADYFDSGSLTPIDIADPQAALAAIERIVASDLDGETARCRDAARLSVLERYNLFPFIADLRARLSPAGPMRSVTIRPKKAFRTLGERLRGKADRLSHGLSSISGIIKGQS
jgi:hypothetical protein